MILSSLCLVFQLPVIKSMSYCLSNLVCRYSLSDASVSHIRLFLHFSFLFLYFACSCFPFGFAVLMLYPIRIIVLLKVTPLSQMCSFLLLVFVWSTGIVVSFE